MCDSFILCISYAHVLIEWCVLYNFTLSDSTDRASASNAFHQKMTRHIVAMIGFWFLHCSKLLNYLYYMNNNWYVL